MRTLGLRPAGEGWTGRRRVASGRPEGGGMAGPGRERILAIDVVRGLAVVGMLLVNDAGIPTAMPLALRHAPWQGLTLADQVFPLFLFTVGASMPFSERAQRPAAVLRRAAALFVLGSLLVSAKHHQLAPSTGVLQQIAGAYLLAWALLRLPRRALLPAAAVLLAGIWAAFTFVAAPGVRPGSWAPGSNLAEFVDRSLLGGFSEHGVLVMVASSVSVLAGVAAGRLLLRAPAAGVTLRLLALGAAAGHAGQQRPGAVRRLGAAVRVPAQAMAGGAGAAAGSRRWRHLRRARLRDSDRARGLGACRVALLATGVRQGVSRGALAGCEQLRGGDQAQPPAHEPLDRGRQRHDLDPAARPQLP